ncbi:MAG: GntR family transcriptional regulator [Candidatus Ratteibacteria bacterium]
MNRNVQKFVTRNSPVPLYIQVKEYIKQQIAKGIFLPKQQIPSERKLCAIFNISHITVRQALIELTKEGILFRVPGKGTYVNDNINLLSTVKTETIGVVIPEIKNSYFTHFITDLLLGIKSVSSKQNFSLLLYTENENNYIRDIEEKKIVGLILTNPKIEDIRITMLKNKNFPFVVIGNPTEQGVKSVDNDNILIGYHLTKLLIKYGYKKIGFINGPQHLTVSKDRLEGYKKAITKFNIYFDEKLVKYGDFSEENGYKNTYQLIKHNVDALIGADDLIAIGILQALKKIGKKIPDDIAVVGCNNSPFTAYIHPALTTFDIFPYLLGKKAMEKLAKILKGELTEERTIIKGEIIIRESIAKK